MSKFGTYYARFDGVRSDLTGLPKWARGVFALLILPGLLLVGLSMLAMLASLVALIFLAIPVYVLLRAVAGPANSASGATVYDPTPGRIEAKRVEARIIDPSAMAPDEVNGE